MMERIRAALAEKTYQALLLTSEQNRRYATGFHSTAGCCYLSAKTAVFLTDFRYIEAARAAITGWDVQELAAGASYAEAVNRLLQADGVQTVALEEDTLTQAAYTAWSSNLAAGTCPQDGLLRMLRTRKTPAEVDAIVRAQRIAERAFAEILNEIRAGVTEREIAARLTYLMLHYGAENMSFDPIVVSGANASKPHGVPSDKPLAAGDFVTMDFGCIVDGYCSDMTRTVAVSQVTDEMAAVYDIVLRAQQAGIDTAAAGVTGKAVDGAARAVIEQAGYGAYFGHGFGHGVGLEIHEVPNASPRSTEPLAAGVILTAEPGIYLPGRFGVRIEDMLLLQEGGCENLTRAPKELLVL